ncbi:MAG TPA: signal peptidase II [Solirubrobacteraceae bacterium]|nr:signal peptidase II [Solirubrobacteraceae bacterium]
MLTRGALGAWIWMLVVVGVVFAADRVTKHAVEQSIVGGEERRFLPGIELVHSNNPGVAFRFLPGNHVAVTILIGVALAALLGYFALHATLRLIWLPTGMELGGALGNVYDRITHGSVTDFIQLPLGWPAFNVADACITVGIVILFILIDTSRGRGA